MNLNKTLAALMVATMSMTLAPMASADDGSVCGDSPLALTHGDPVNIGTSDPGFSEFTEATQECAIYSIAAQTSGGDRDLRLATNAAGPTFALYDVSVPEAPVLVLAGQVPAVSTGDGNALFESAIKEGKAYRLEVMESEADTDEQYKAWVTAA